MSSAAYFWHDFLHDWFFVDIQNLKALCSLGKVKGCLHVNVTHTVLTNDLAAQ